MKNINSKVNQHYIPKFYQRLFSKNKKSTGKYLVDQGKYILNSSIKDTGANDYYYGKNEFIENMFMEIEGISSLIIKDIIQSNIIPPYSSGAYDMLLLFVAALEARVQKSGDNQNQFLSSLTKVMVEMDNSHSPNKIDNLDLFNIKAGYKVPTLISIKCALELYRIIDDLKCCLIISDIIRDYCTTPQPHKH